MPRLDRLSEVQRKSSLADPCLLNESAPYTRLRRPLSDSRLALVTIAGIHLRADSPFVGGDQSFRVIPSDTPPEEIVQSHMSIGFDRTAFQRDLNVVFPVDWVREFVQRGEIGSFGRQDINLAQASTVSNSEVFSDSEADVAFEVTTLRPYYEQWVSAHAGRTAVRVTRVDQRRFRGLVRVLEAYVAGRDVDVPEWNRDLPLPQFVRWAADDLKAFYLEARMQQKPAATFQELNGWLWSHTARSNLLRGVRARMREQGDPKLDALAFGIAR